LLFVLAATWSFHARAVDGVAALTDLPEGDQLEISFFSRGCFHFHAYDLTFRRAIETTVSITQVKNVENRVELGQFTLSKAEVDDLDKLVRLHRSSSPGPCASTTWESITISQRHEGKIVATEKYANSSCGTEVGIMLSIGAVTSIPTLVRRLQEPK
jgi:hypothetical protein